MKNRILCGLLGVFFVLSVCKLNVSANTGVLSTYGDKTEADYKEYIEGVVSSAGDNQQAQAEARKAAEKVVETEKAEYAEFTEWIEGEWEALEERRSSGQVLTKRSGVYYFNGTQRETYYNLNMSKIVSIMRSKGFSEEEFPYWVRDDGCKMLGDYIIVAANLGIHPRGTVVETSLGPALVCDTGGFAKRHPYGVDIAVTW